MSPERFLKHRNSVLRIVPFFFAALFVLEAGAAERVAIDNASGDCAKQAQPAHGHRWNPLKMPQKLEHKLSDFALSVSSIGMDQTPAVCPVVEPLNRPDVTKARASIRPKTNQDTVTPGL